LICAEEIFGFFVSMGSQRTENAKSAKLTNYSLFKYRSSVDQLHYKKTTNLGKAFNYLESEKPAKKKRLSRLESTQQQFIRKIICGSIGLCLEKMEIIPKFRPFWNYLYTFFDEIWFNLFKIIDELAI